MQLTNTLLAALTSVALLSLTSACDVSEVTDDFGEPAPDGVGDVGGEGEVEIEEMIDEGADLPAPIATLATKSFSENPANIVNPERGYYIGVDLLSSSSPASVASKGHSLALAIVRLDAYRYSSIDAAFLSKLQTGMNNVRAAGIKIILRFTYNSSFSADASKSRILGHISQLTPLLQQNADVISVMQAGFIGAWGEWHGSTNGLENNTDRKAILDALLAALPASRMVQIRTPMYKEGAYPGGALTSATAWNGSNRSRVGHHNDCFLASSSDLGTYASPVATWRDYVAKDAAFTPTGGETCKVYTTKTACTPAVAEMAALRFSYLNKQYHPDVVNGFESGGCGDQIRKRLGYRMMMTSASHATSVAAGGVLPVTFEINNTGFSAPFNSRPVYVVLRKGSTMYVGRPGNNLDARSFGPGKRTITTNFRISASAPAGDYDLALWMPDQVSTLRNNPKYSIQLANAGTWESTTGLNIIARGVKVTAP